MDFSITDDQKMALDTVDRFIERHAAGGGPPPGRGALPPYDLLPAMGEAGLFGIAVPTADGGTGQDWETVAWCRSGSPGMPMRWAPSSTAWSASASCRSWPTDRPRSSAPCCRALAAGRYAHRPRADRAGRPAATPPRSSRGARRADGGWRDQRPQDLDQRRGQRRLSCSTAVRTRRAAPGPTGISHAAGPAPTPGISMTPLRQDRQQLHAELGHRLRGCATCRDDALMGEEGRGFRHLMSTLALLAAPGMAATVTGCAQAARRLAPSRTPGARQQFGRPDRHVPGHPPPDRRHADAGRRRHAWLCAISPG